MPKIAMLEGYGSPFGTAFCSSFDAAFSALKAAHLRAKTVGVPEDHFAMTEAARFIDNNSGFWGTNLVAWGEGCEKLTADANYHLNQVNIATRQVANVAPISSGAAGTSMETPLGLGGGLGDVKWIVWGAVGLLALLYTGPVINAVSSAVAGRSRRRRR